jgi:hypothetical protein
VVAGCLVGLLCGLLFGCKGPAPVLVQWQLVQGVVVAVWPHAATAPGWLALQDSAGWAAAGPGDWRLCINKKVQFKKGPSC